MGGLSRIIEPIRRLFGRRKVSVELSGESILVRCDDKATELVRIPDIQTWDSPHLPATAVLIRLRNNRSIVFGDNRGALREILERVAPDRRVTDQRQC